jgi:uncharacterized protein (DUF1697 family)
VWAGGTNKMSTFVSMLRGINVGSQKKIKMDELVTLYKLLGFKNVRTYMQSGNVIFNAMDTDAKKLSSTIQEKIEQVFKFSVAVLLRKPSELRQIITLNPFLQEKDIDKLYVTFLSDTPSESNLNRIREVQGDKDKFVALNREVYLYCPNGYGRTKFSNDFFEKKLGVNATTRNWRTIKTLLEVADNQSD